jgi:hypothetical protein
VLVVFPEHRAKPLVEVPHRHPELGRPRARAGQASAQAVDHVRVQIAVDEAALEDRRHEDQGLGVLTTDRVGRAVPGHLSSR